MMYFAATVLPAPVSPLHETKYKSNQCTFIFTISFSLHLVSPVHTIICVYCGINSNDVISICGILFKTWRTGQIFRKRFFRCSIQSFLLHFHSTEGTVLITSVLQQLPFSLHYFEMCCNVMQRVNMSHMGD